MASDVAPPEATVQDTFEYSPFINNHSIRILTLQPGSDDYPLVGRLTNEDLTSEPEYEAISYVWGVGTRSSTLLLYTDAGGTPASLALTQSIHDALVRLRHPTAPRRLWADQICINQRDIAERGQQVALMNAIYKSARQILVWLGKDFEGFAAEAVRMVHYLHGVFTDEAAHEAFRVAHSEDLAMQSERPWVPLSKLTKLPWFNRLWIVQEAGTSRPTTLYWGDVSIDWETLSAVANVLSQEYHHLRTRFQIYTPSIRYLYRRFVPPDDAWDENHNRGSFVYELHRARHLLSKDPKDHVYAFLGHFSIAGSSPALAGIRADYSRAVEDIYCEVAACVLRGAASLILLSACQAPTPRKRGKVATPAGALPSWVPDWRLPPLILLGSPDTPHRAAGETAPRLEVDEERRVVHVLGRRVDVVGRSSQTFYGRDFHVGGAGGRNKLESLWRVVCGYGTTVDLKRRYRDGGGGDGDEGSAFFALVQTLVNGGISSDKSRPHSTIPPSEWLANGAAFLLRSRGEAQPSLLSYSSSWSSTISTDSTASTSTTATASSAATVTAEEEEVDIAAEIQELAAHGDAFKWGYGATLVTRYRRFAVTAGGYLLVGPSAMRRGDVLAVLYGGKTPFLLREREGGGGWALLGECYVHGLMNGEALQGDQEDEVFSIY